MDPSVHPVPMLLGTKSTSRDVTPPTTTTNISEYVFVLVPGGAVQPSSYLFVGCQTGHSALGSSVHRVLSMRPKHQRINDASIPTLPPFEDVE